MCALHVQVNHCNHSCTEHCLLTGVNLGPMSNVQKLAKIGSCCYSRFVECRITNRLADCIE